MKAVAWLLPSLAPQSTSRYCASMVIDQLLGRYAVELFAPSAGSVGSAPVKKISEFSAERFALTLLQLEDIVGVEEIRPYLRISPSVVWFHDIVLGGEPLGPKEIETCELALFSGFRNQSELKSLRSERSWSLPFPVRPLAELGAHGSERVAFAGTPWSESRAEELFAALRLMPQQVELLWMLDESELHSAQQLLDRFPEQRVSFHVERSAERWSEIVPGCGCAVHLRVSAIGDPGPLLPISWSLGVPTVVSDFAEGDYLQPSVTAKVRPGISEIEQLAETLGKLLQESVSTTAQRAAALDYAREFHHHLAVTAELERLFDRL